MKAHWIKFAPADFLNGTVDLNPEQTGAYIVILSLIWDRGGPIPDDEGWLARRLGCTRHQWRKLRGQLFELGKLSRDDAGNLTNRRAMQEVHRVQEISAKRAEAARASHENRDLFEDEGRNNKGLGYANASLSGVSGHETAGNRHSRDANAHSREPLAKSDPAEKTDESGEKISRIHEKKGQEKGAEMAEKRDVNSVFAEIPSRGRAREQESKISNNNDQLSPPPHARAREGTASDDRPMGIYDLTIACCEACGMAARIASRPALLTQSIEIVKGWQSSGIDILETAVPVIAQAFDRMNEPAHSLAKFSAAIDTHHAKAKRHEKRNGTPLPPPPPAVFEFSDEAESIARFRKALCAQIGRANYSQFCNAVAFRVIDWRNEGDAAALQLSPREGAANRVWEPGFILERHGTAIRQLAKSLLGSETVLTSMQPLPCSAKQSGTKP